LQVAQEAYGHCWQVEVELFTKNPFEHTVQTAPAEMQVAQLKSLHTMQTLEVRKKDDEQVLQVPLAVQLLQG
jgi:hypothetical protein